MSTEAAVWIDTAYDTEQASNGHSRYGAYVRDRIDWFADCWDGCDEGVLPARFAATAWRIATGPVMVPGYIRRHRRVLSTELACSYWDGSLLARVDLITPWPQPLRQDSGWVKQTDRGWWRDWPIEFGDAYCEPGDEDLAKAPYLLTTASLRFTVPSAELSDAPRASGGAGLPDPAALLTAAQQSVARAVRAVNRVVWPVIDQLEHS